MIIPRGDRKQGKTSVPKLLNFAVYRHANKKAGSNDMMRKESILIVQAARRKKRRWPEMAPTDRFQCVSKLVDIIGAKQVAYTDAERREWLSVILMCLDADNDFFSNVDLCEQRSSAECTAVPPCESEYFLQYFSHERSWDSGLYSYIHCAKARYAKAAIVNRGI